MLVLGVKKMVGTIYCLTRGKFITTRDMFIEVTPLRAQ